MVFLGEKGVLALASLSTRQFSIVLGVYFFQDLPVCLSVLEV